MVQILLYSLDVYIMHHSGVSYAIIPAIIAGVATLASTAAAAAAQHRANKARQQAQSDANQWTLDQWNRQNAYNDPVQQRKRLEAAGINPYMAMSSMNPGVAETVQSQPAPSIEAEDALGKGIANIAPNIMSMTSSFAELKKKKSEGEGLDLDNQFKQATMIQRIDAMRQNLRSTTAKAAMDELNENLLRETYKNRRDLSDISVSQAKQDYEESLVRYKQEQLRNDTLQFYKDKMQPAELSKLNNEMDNIVQDTALKLSSKKLNDSQVQTEVTKRLLNVMSASSQGASAEGQRIENKVNSRVVNNLVDEIRYRATIERNESARSIYERKGRDAINPKLREYTDYGKELVSPFFGGFRYSRVHMSR